AAAGATIGVSLVSVNLWNRLLGSVPLSLDVPSQIAEAGRLLLIPILILAAIFAVLAVLEFAVAGSGWWRRLRALIMDGWRGRVGLMLLAALIASIIISFIRWEIQFLAV